MTRNLRDEEARVKKLKGVQVKELKGQKKEMVLGIKWHQEGESWGKVGEEEGWSDGMRVGEGKNGMSGSKKRREEVGGG